MTARITYSPLYSPLQLFKPWYFSSFSSHLVFRDTPIPTVLFWTLSPRNTSLYLEVPQDILSPPPSGVSPLQVSNPNLVKMFLYTVSAARFMPGVVDIGFCYTGPVFVLLWLVPLCCLSIRNFQPH